MAPSTAPFPSGPWFASWWPGPRPTRPPSSGSASPSSASAWRSCCPDGTPTACSASCSTATTSRAAGPTDRGDLRRPTWCSRARSRRGREMIGWIEAQRAGRQRPLAQRPVHRRRPLRGAVRRRHGQRQVLPVHGHRSRPSSTRAADAPSPAGRRLTWPSRSTTTSASAAGRASRPAPRGPSPRAAASRSPTRSTRCCATTASGAWWSARSTGWWPTRTGRCATDAAARCRRAGTPAPSAARAVSVCPTCGSVLWRVDGGDWTCRVCVAAADGSRAASCPKVKRAHRLRTDPPASEILRTPT